MARESNSPMDIRNRNRNIDFCTASIYQGLNSVNSTENVWYLECGVLSSNSVKFGKVRCFAVTYSLNLQCRNVNQVISQQKKAMSSNFMLLNLPFNPEDWGDIFLTSSELHGIRNQNTVIVTAVRTSNPNH